MKDYIVFRSVLGLIGSIIAIGLGIGFLVVGISEPQTRAILIGIAAILGGIVGLIICIIFLLKSKK